MQNKYANQIIGKKKVEDCFRLVVFKNEKGAVERLKNDQSRAFSILEDRLKLLTDMKHVYSRADTLQKKRICKHGVRQQSIL